MSFTSETNFAFPALNIVPLSPVTTPIVIPDRINNTIIVIISAIRVIPRCPFGTGS